MAGPKVHGIATLPIIVLSWIIYTPVIILSKNTFILCLVLFLGFGMDFVDHLSIRRIKKILRGEKGPIKGWINGCTQCAADGTDYILARVAGGKFAYLRKFTLFIVFLILVFPLSLFLAKWLP